MRILLCLRVIVLSVVVSTPALAVDGVIEINQTCAVQSGCFPGDSAGFPVTIAVSGSYRLTSSLLVSSTTDAIWVLASLVSLDLNGFGIVGPVTCSGGGATLTCSSATAGVRGIDGSSARTSVRDGVVRGFGGGGILVGSHASISDVHVEENAGNGIQAGQFAELLRASTALNDGNGIVADGASRVSGAVARGNKLDGISVNNASVVEASRSYLNGRDGYDIAFGCVLTDSATYLNAGDGIDVRGGSLIRGNTAYSNGGSGGGYQINSDSSEMAYVENVLRRTTGDLGFVNMGVNAGGNTCGSVLCP